MDFVVVGTVVVKLAVFINFMQATWEKQTAIKRSVKCSANGRILCLNVDVIKKLLPTCIGLCADLLKCLAGKFTIQIEHRLLWTDKRACDACCDGGCNAWFELHVGSDMVTAMSQLCHHAMFD